MARLLERFKLEVFQSSPLPTGSHRVFKASLEIDGSINVGGHSWRDGFPSYPLAAVRNLSEGRRLLDSAKPTGGWPYWQHYLDEITGEWESLAHLWERACGMGGTEPGRGKLARASKATMVVSAERDLRDRP
jgi:hypothetical protein